MRKLALIPVCAIALMVPLAVLASAGEGGFDGVVHSIEHQYHVRATRIPLMGLVSLIARGATHGAVSGMHIAEFEHFSAEMNGEELNRMVEEKLGREWELVVRETHSRGASQTLIYMRGEGDRMGMFVLDAGGNDLNVVQLSVDPQHLAEQVNHYEHHERHEQAAQDVSD